MTSLATSVASTLTRLFAWPAAFDNDLADWVHPREARCSWNRSWYPQLWDLGLRGSEAGAEIARRGPGWRLYRPSWRCSSAGLTWAQRTARPRAVGPPSPHPTPRPRSVGGCAASAPVACGPATFGSAPEANARGPEHNPPRPKQSPTGPGGRPTVAVGELLVRLAHRGLAARGDVAPRAPLLGSSQLLGRGPPGGPEPGASSRTCSRPAGPARGPDEGVHAPRANGDRVLGPRRRVGPRRSCDAVSGHRDMIIMTSWS